MLIPIALSLVTSLPAMAVATQALAPETTITLQSGATRAGEISGWLIFKQPLTEPRKGVAYLLVEGAKVLRIDAGGVHLVKDAPILVIYVRGDGIDTDYAPLGVAFDFAKSMPNFAFSRMEANINVDQHCCAISSIVGSPIREQLLGEFREAAVVPSLRVTHTGSSADLPVADIVKVK